jgi:cell division protein FtsB
MFCKECQSCEVVTGCQYCLKEKVEQLQANNRELAKQLNFLKNELELINEQSHKV